MMNKDDIRIYYAYVVLRMVVGGRDALQKVIDDMVKKAQENVLEKKRDV